jgi:hypothetical protein
MRSDPQGRSFAASICAGQLTEHRLYPGDVARILRRRCAAAGVAGDFAGHSLWRGFITNAAKKTVPIESIKRVTGQRSSGIVFDFVAAATIDEDPPLLERSYTREATRQRSLKSSPANSCHIGLS